MKNQLLKRKLNPFLLISTVLVLSILAGLSVMYQSELSDLVSTRKELKSSLEDKRKKISKLSKLNKDLNSTIMTLEDKLAKEKRLKQEKDNKIENLNTKIKDIQEENSNLRSRVENLNETVYNLQNSLEDVNTSFNRVCELGNLSESQEVLCEQQGHETG